MPAQAEVLAAPNLERLRTEVAQLEVVVACGAQTHAAVRALLDRGALVARAAYARHLSQRAVNMIPGASDTPPIIAYNQQKTQRSLPMPKIPIAVQLYSVRDDCARDLPGNLKAIAEMGYSGVEFAGYHARSAKELRALLDDLNLKCCGTHTGLNTLLGDALEQTAEFNLALGNPNLVVPGLPEEYRNSKEAWLRTAELFNEIALRLKPYGLRTGYHNHSAEFQNFDGQTAFDIFFASTSTEVICQFDTGNAAEGLAVHGVSSPLQAALTFLERYASSSVTVHLKEYSASNPQALIGEGEIPWQRVFDICEDSGATAWYIVEQESYPVSPLESIRRCREALQKMGK